MLILGKIISLIPGFKNSIIFYTVLQFIMISYFFFSLNTNKINYPKIFYLVFLCNTYLVFSTTELWSQFFSTSINLFVLGVIFNLLKHKKKINIFQLLNLTLLLSSFYLGGVLNSISFFLICSFLIYKKKLKLYFHIDNRVISNFLFFLVLIFFIWIPFIKNININDFLIGSGTDNPLFNIANILETIFINNFKDPFLIHSDYEIFTTLLLRIRTLIRISNLLINILFMGVLLLTLFNNILSENKINISYRPKIIFFIICFNYLLTPFLGGPNFFANERIDMELSLYFLFLIGSVMFIWEVFVQIKYGDQLTKLYIFSLSIFIILNIMYSFHLYKEYIDYNESLVSNSDVPLKYKLQVVDYLYQDALSSNLLINNEIKVFYDLSGNNFGWINEFGRNYPEYYDSPYTIGRIFDLLLLKEFNIKNSQENIQLRRVDDVDYVVTYRFNSKINVDNLKVTSYKEINRFKIYKLYK